MSVIWKYKLETPDEQIIQMPRWAKILCVDTQHGKPYLWALVNPKYDKIDVCIRVVETGHVIRGMEDWNYIGIYKLDDGSVMFHVFTV